MSPLLTSPLRYTAFPMLLVSATFATFAFKNYGYDFLLVLNLVALCVFLALFALERIIPYRQEWTHSDGQRLNDLGHALFGTGLGAGIGNLLVSLSFVPVTLSFFNKGGGPIWPTAWPLWIQVVLLVLLADFGRYIQHRLMHVVPFLWRFHALHHSGEHLTIFKTSRSHIIERIFQQILMYGPLTLLGVPQEILLYYLVPNTFLGLMDHSNADLQLGYLEYVIMGPKGHRLHHSEDMKQGNSNFGSAILFWDVLLGTFCDPLKTPAPERMGIPNDPTPQEFLLQITEPFQFDLPPIAKRMLRTTGLFVFLFIVMAFLG